MLQNFQVLIGLERELLALAAKPTKKVSSALMSDSIRQQEKEVWMYNAYLG
jgi:starvation-inducible DNA-binding protein